MDKLRSVLLLGLCSVALVLSCKKDDKIDGQSLIERHGLAGTFTAQISPAFMGTNPMASGEHPIRFEDIGSGRLRLHFEKFRAEPMPFEMTVAIILDVKAGPGNTVILEGKDGKFLAEPPNGGAIDPKDFPGGIQLPDGAEGGLSSEQASVTGSYALTRKDGQEAWRYELDLTPGVPLPIQVLIYSKSKN